MLGFDIGEELLTINTLRDSCLIDTTTTDRLCEIIVDVNEKEQLIYEKKPNLSIKGSEEITNKLKQIQHQISSTLDQKEMDKLIEIRDELRIKISSVLRNSIQQLDEIKKWNLERLLMHEKFISFFS